MTETIGKLAIVFALLIGIAVVLYVQRQSKKQVIEIIPSWKNGEIIGDGAWNANHQAQYPSRSRPEVEPKGM